jgi:hypothetical protein
MKLVASLQPNPIKNFPGVLCFLLLRTNGFSTILRMRYKQICSLTNTLIWLDPFHQTVLTNWNCATWLQFPKLWTPFWSLHIKIRHNKPSSHKALASMTPSKEGSWCLRTQQSPVWARMKSSCQGYSPQLQVLKLKSWTCYFCQKV